jgi:hypothetical protein
MDKSLLMYRGGVRSVVRTLSDGKEHTLYYKAKTPNELAAYFGALAVLEPGEQGSVARQKQNAKLIANSLCDEEGAPLMTLAEAELIPATLKREICDFITIGSSEAGVSGNDLPPREKTGSGTSSPLPSEGGQ